MIKYLVKSVLERSGYRVFRSDCLPIGVSLPDDLKALAGKDKIKTVFDVGANNGRFSVVMAEHFPNASIYAFEPVEGTFEKLKESCARYSNIQCVNLALGDRQGSTFMQVMTCNEMNSIEVNPLLQQFFSEAIITPKKSVEIQLDTLDHFMTLNELHEIDLLKIDTEGHDLQVLKGASNLLNQKEIRFILIEYYRPAKSNHLGTGFLDEIAIFLEPFKFQYVTSYTEWVDSKRNYFGVHNALFALTR